MRPFLKPFRKTLSRVRAAFTEPEDRDVVSDRSDIPEAVCVPAAGGVFDFIVDCTLSWTTQDFTPRQLRAVIPLCADRAAEDIEFRALQFGHRFGAEEAEELESALIREFQDKPIRFTSRKGDIGCQPQVRVTVDPDIRDALRPNYLERMRLDSEYATKMHRADLVDTLSRRWSDLLRDIKDQPLIAHAAALTAEDFAQVVKEMDADRQHHGDELLDLLREANERAGNLRMGAYEWAQAFDRLLKQQPGSESAFPETDEEQP